MNLLWKSTFNVSVVCFPGVCVKTSLLNFNILTFDLAVNQETSASRYQDITLTMDGLNSVQCDAHSKQVDVKQLYNPVPEFESVCWSQLQLKFELQFEAVRTSSQQRAWALRTPGWAAQQNEKEVLLKSEEPGVNMLQSVRSPTHLSHKTLSQPFRNHFE